MSVAGEGLDVLALPRKTTGELGQRKVVVGNLQSTQLDELQQALMPNDLAVVGDLPLLFLRLLEHAAEIVLLEDDECCLGWATLLEFGEEDGVARAEDVEAVGLVVLGVAVEVLAMGEVEEGGAVEFPVVPVGEVEGEVVVDEDAQSVALPLPVHSALVLSVAVV